MARFTTRIRFVLPLLLLPVIAMGCGGVAGGVGGGAGGAPGAQTQLALFLADLNVDGLLEAFLVDYTAPGAVTQLNAPMTAANSGIISLGLNDGYMVYTADHDTPGQGEAYLVHYDDPGVATKLNAPLGPMARVSGAWTSPDRRWVVYRADQDTDEVWELYLVDTAAPGNATKLNPPLVAGGDVGPAFFSQNSDRVYYTADQDTDGVTEMYMVALNAPGVATKINGPLVAGGDVLRVAQSPSGARMLYVADEDTDEVNELYLVDVNTPGVSTKLNPALVADGDVAFQFQFAPDGARVVYIADAVTNDVDEVWSVSVNAPGAATRLHGVFPDDMRDATVLWSFVPGTQSLLYSSDQITDGQTELFLVDLDAPGLPARVHGPLPAGANVQGVHASPDGQRLLYFADQNAVGVLEAFLVDIDNLGVGVQANDLLVPGSGGVKGALFSADSRFIQYVAEQDTGGVAELYIVPVANPGPGNSTNLSGPLPLTAEIQLSFPLPVEALFNP